MKTIPRKHLKGFAMPVVLIVSSALIVLSVALLQSVTSLRTYALNQYYEIGRAHV